MKEKFQFLFVYDDKTESSELVDNKKMNAIRISDDCCLSVEHFADAGYTASAAFDYAQQHGMSLLTPAELKLVSKRLSGCVQCLNSGPVRLIWTLRLVFGRRIAAATVTIWKPTYSVRTSLC